MRPAKFSTSGGFRGENQRKTIGKWWFPGDFNGDLLDFMGFYEIL